MTALYFLDTVSYAITLLLIASSRMKKNRLQYLIAFVLLIVMQLLLGANNYFSILVAGIVLSLCFWQKHDRLQCIYECFYCVCILAIGIMLISSLFLLLFTASWLASPLLRILMNILLIGLGVIWKVVTNYCQRKPERVQAHRLQMGMQIALLLFYTFVMNTIQFDDEKDLAMLSLLFITLIFLIALLLNQLQITQEKQQQKHLQQEYIDDITHAYEQSVERDHYFIQLLRSMKSYIADNDMKQLAQYFEEHIEPIARNSFALPNSKQIQNKLLRNLVQNELNDLAKQKNILIDCEFVGNIDMPYHLISDIFKLLAECFANAKKELQKQTSQKHAYVQIYFLEIQGVLSFKIANSISNPTSNYFDVKQQEHGGSRMFKRILKHHKKIEYSSYIRVLPLGSFTLFVQEIMIDTKEENYAKSTTK